MLNTNKIKINGADQTYLLAG